MEKLNVLQHLLLGGLPILIYLILWISIPSRNQAKKTERKRIFLSQTISLIVGAIIGGYFGFSISSSYEVLILVPVGILIGGVIGFFVIKLSSIKQ